MSAAKRSLPGTAGLQIAFERVGTGRLSPLPGLFDGRVPAGEDAPLPVVPVITCRNGKKLLIIDGCKRVALLKKQGKGSAVCGIVKKALTAEEAGLLRIRLNACRPLHPREKLLFLGWLASHFDRKEYQKHAEKLCLPANEQYEYEQLLKCRPWLVEAAMQGRLDRTVAPEMNHLSQEQAGCVTDLFSKLAFSRSMQRELAEWLPEIAFIRKTGLPELLGSGRFAELLGDTRLNAPQKAAKIHEEAHVLRFPLYSEVKKSWGEKARRINPDPSSVSLQGNPFFEKNGLEIRIKTDRSGELQKILRQLASVDLNDWQELINPCAGAVPPLPATGPDSEEP
jgi:hypothetical protein